MSSSGIPTQTTFPGSNTPLTREGSQAPNVPWYQLFQSFFYRTGGLAGINGTQLTQDVAGLQASDAAFSHPPPKSRPALPFGITVSASPFSYPSAVAGTVLVTGGTVSAIALSRDRATFFTVPTGVVPVTQGDLVKVTYSVKPTMTMVPG